MSALRVLYVKDDARIARLTAEELESHGVEDARLARLTAEELESHGVEVHVVPSGDHAVADVQRMRPDVVLLDPMLPGDDGPRIDGSRDSGGHARLKPHALFAALRARPLRNSSFFAE